MLNSPPKIEIKKVVFSFDDMKSTSSNGITFIFFKSLWNIISDDVLELFEDFFRGSLEIDKLKYAFIALLPKKDGALTARDIKPINLLHSFYKIITKVLADRLIKFLPSLIDEA